MRQRYPVAYDAPLALLRLDTHAAPLHLLRRYPCHGSRIAPSILELLGDGVWRSRKAIVAALAEQHEKDEIVRTLMRLALIGQVVDVDRKYGLPAATEPGQD